MTTSPSVVEIGHGCYRGSYADFDALRCIWSEYAGYGVIDFRDEGGPWVLKLDLLAYTEDDILGEWPDGAPDDPLVIVLIHNEKAGRIKNSHCRILADRLEQLEQNIHRGS